LQEHQEELLDGSSQYSSLFLFCGAGRSRNCRQRGPVGVRCSSRFLYAPQQQPVTVGCDVCHVSSINTAPAGTVINGGTFTVPAALGGKTIHPYSDFLLHNVGTGDGIVQNGPQVTANKMRTPPLWGLRTRSRLMHDLLSMTRNDAIMRHSGEALGVINSYRSLPQSQRNQLLTFLDSL
jgi:CxxC motif-containing protein (DUF1111 family)